MTIRLHILDTPWNNADLMQWWRWQCSMNSRDPNCVHSNPMFVPRYCITEKQAFGARVLLFWRQIYRRTWSLGSSTRGVSFQVGRQVWSCGQTDDPAFRNPSTREAFTAACSSAVARARAHYNLGQYTPTLTDGAVRFHAFCENSSQQDMSAFQEAYTAGTSEQVSPEAVEINTAARGYNPTEVGYAPVARINALLSTDATTDWAVTADEEDHVIAILYNVLMRGASHWTVSTAVPVPMASIETVRAAVCAEESQADSHIPVINVRELHRILFYCNASRLEGHMQDHWTAESNNQKYSKLLEIMDTCIQRRCVNRHGIPWLSLSSAMLRRNPSHLLY